MAGLIVHLIAGVAKAAIKINREFEREEREAIRSAERARYQGARVRGLPEGDGVMNYRNGSVYRGKFKAGKRHGFGELRTASGVVFRGQWEADALHGKGTQINMDGSVYEGEYLVGQRNGRGMYRWANRVTYDGEWVANTQRGFGTYDFTASSPQNPTLWRGQFWNGVRHGFGINVSLNSKEAYEEEWKEGKFVKRRLLTVQEIPQDILARINAHSQSAANQQVAAPGGPAVRPAVAVAASAPAAAAAPFGYVPGPALPTIAVTNVQVTSGLYTGHVLKSSPTVPHCPPGSGLPPGKLVAPTWSYEGFFEKARFTGHGKTLISSNGGVREGNYFQSKLNGQGSYFVPNVSYYKGEFRDSKYHGRGVLQLLKSGLTVDGSFIDGVAEGYGRMYWTAPNPRMEYEGQISKGKRDGYGHLKMIDHQMEYEGTYSQSIRQYGALVWLKEDAKAIAYEGAFGPDNQPMGFGKMLLRTGWVYMGTWKGFKPHGEGTYVRWMNQEGQPPLGTWFRGTVDMGKLVEKKEEGMMTPEEVQGLVDTIGSTLRRRIAEAAAMNPAEAAKVGVAASSSAVAVAPAAAPIVAQTSAEEEQEPGGMSMAMAGSSTEAFPTIASAPPAPASAYSIPTPSAPLASSVAAVVSASSSSPASASASSSPPAAAIASPSAGGSSESESVEAPGAAAAAGSGASSDFDLDAASMSDALSKMAVKEKPKKLEEWSVQQVDQWLMESVKTLPLTVEVEVEVQEKKVVLLEGAGSSSSSSKKKEKQTLDTVDFVRGKFDSACVDGASLAAVNSEQDLIDLDIPANLAAPLLAEVQTLKKTHA